MKGLRDTRGCEGSLPPCGAHHCDEGLKEVTNKVTPLSWGISHIADHCTLEVVAAVAQANSTKMCCLDDPLRHP